MYIDAIACIKKFFESRIIPKIIEIITARITEYIKTWAVVIAANVNLGPYSTIKLKKFKLYLSLQNIKKIRQPKLPD